MFILPSLSSVFIYLLNYLLGIIFMYTNHPVIMIICLISFTCSSAAMSTYFINNAYYGYTFLLIFVGGMMIVFIYMCSILPNSKMSWIHHSFFFFIFLSYFINYFFTDLFNPQLTMNNPLYEFHVSLSTLILACYLLITLLVINTTNKHQENNMRSIN